MTLCLGDHALMTEMVSEILRQLYGLDGGRRQAFLDWLQAHRRGLPLGSGGRAEVGSALTVWFESLSPASILWEFLLLTNEISWWQSQPVRALTEEEVKCSSS